MAPNTGTVKTRVCIVSDTHNQSPGPTCRFFTHPLPSADVFIHAGDLTVTGKHIELAATIQWLETAPAPLKLVIPGNHDITLDETYYPTRQWQHRGGSEDPKACRALFETPAAREAGVVYLEEGTHAFRLANGALLTVYASGYTPAFCNWAFAYQRSEDRFNNDTGEVWPPNPCPTDGVDVLLTHGPPYGLLDQTLRGDSHVGCAHLRRAVARVRPRVVCFGHIHEAYGALLATWGRGAGDGNGNGEEEGTETVGLAGHVPLSVVDLSSNGRREEGPPSTRAEDLLGRKFEAGRDTLLVNASIMDVGYSPVNAPWVVDMDLPAAVLAE